MIKERKGFKPKGGKTSRALEVTAEELTKGEQVIYITDELGAIEVSLLMFERYSNISCENLVIYHGNNIPTAFNLCHPEDVIVIDILKDVTEEAKNLQNKVYVYYQEKA